MKTNLGKLILRHRFLWMVLLAHGVIWATVDVFVSPHPDYIDHWAQSRVWSLSYFEHPPMVAWMIRALVTLFGSSEAGLQAGALLVSLGLLALIYGLSVNLFGLNAGKLTLLGLESTAFFQAKSLSIQTEQPLVLFWVAALWALIAYLKTGRSRWMLLVGLLAGLGALSKYTMILFYLSWFTYLLIVPGRRKELLNPWQYAGGLLALAVFLPVLIWNQQHDWISFRFQFSKGEAGPVTMGTSSLNFLLGAVFTYSPLLFGWGLWRMGMVWRREGLRDSPETLLAVMTIVPLAFFTIALVRSEYSDPHWAVLSAVCLLIWLGKDLREQADRGRAGRVGVLIGAALVLNLGLLSLVAVHTYRPFLPLIEAYDPTRQIVGWREAGTETEALLTQSGMRDPEYVVSFFYPLSSQFALHLPSQPLPYSFQREQRNLWVNRADIRGDNTFVVCKVRDCDWVKARMRDRFGWETLTALGTVQPRVWGTPRELVTILRKAE